MANCKYCGCSGWFFRMDESGLCGKCRHIVALDVEQSSRIIQDCASQAEQTQNPHSKLMRLDLMIKQLESLAKYENHGIPTIDGSPSARISEASVKRDEILLGTARSELKDILEEVQNTPVPEKKIAYYSKFLLRSAEYKKRMARPGPLEDLEAQAKEAVHRIRLNIPLEKARSAETRGKKDKALEYYMEALNFLKTNDPERAALAEHIPHIEAKIRELE